MFIQAALKSGVKHGGRVYFPLGMYSKILLSSSCSRRNGRIEGCNRCVRRKQPLYCIEYQTWRAYQALEVTLSCLRGAARDREVSLEYCPTTDIMDNILTIALGLQNFSHLKNLMPMMVSLLDARD